MWKKVMGHKEEQKKEECHHDPCIAVAVDIRSKQKIDIGLLINNWGAAEQLYQNNNFV